MDNKYDILITEFEQNIQKLIAENNELKNKHSLLDAELQKKQEEIMIAHKDLVELRTEYNNLLSVNMLNSSVEGRKRLKLFLAEMVKEIDKLILLIKK